MDGLGAVAEIVRYAGVGQLLRLTVDALCDAAGAVAGSAPHTVAIKGPHGSRAAISSPDAESGYGSIIGPGFRNEMRARGILGIPLNRPVAAAPRVRCPMLFVVAAGDTIAPPAAVRTAARRAGRPAEVLEIDGGHSDIDTGQESATAVAAQVAFLEKHVAPRVGV